MDFSIPVPLRAFSLRVCELRLSITNVDVVGLGIRGGDVEKIIRKLGR